MELTKIRGHMSHTSLAATRLSWVRASLLCPCPIYSLSRTHAFIIVNVVAHAHGRLARALLLDGRLHRLLGLVLLACDTCLAALWLRVEESRLEALLLRAAASGAIACLRRRHLH